MKVGDIVKLKLLTSARAGVVTDLVERKCWRTSLHGKKINWDLIDPEPHAVVLFDDGTVRIPTVDLEIINKAR